MPKFTIEAVSDHSGTRKVETCESLQTALESAIAYPGWLIRNQQNEALISGTYRTCFIHMILQPF